MFCKPFCLVHRLSCGLKHKLKKKFREILKFQNIHSYFDEKSVKSLEFGRKMLILSEKNMSTGYEFSDEKTLISCLCNFFKENKQFCNNDKSTDMADIAQMLHSSFDI